VQIGSTISTWSTWVLPIGARRLGDFRHRRYRRGIGEDVVEGKDGCAARFRGVAIFAQEVGSFADKLAGGATNGHGAGQNV
jgi:hypothetical protein